MEMTIDDLWKFLIGFFKGGHKLNNKVIRKCTPTSGALYLHKTLIGKTFDVYLIPTEPQPQVKDEVEKVEEKLKELKNL